MAVVYIFLYIFVKKDLGHRYVLLNVANPFCAVFFFAWSLAITLSDAVKYNVVDPAVFMTFSLTVPLSFFLFPAVYAVIVIAADLVMLYATATVSGELGPMINLTIFFLFQLVLGISYLRLKMRLAERIVQEEENAGIDVLTGFPNRRLYEEEMKKLLMEPAPEDLVYIAIDLNGLKEVNDTYGHEVGDNLIIGAVACIDHCFGKTGKRFRIGGDEFVVLTAAKQEKLSSLLDAYEKQMADWFEKNMMTLSAAVGSVCRAEFPGKSITELARMADRRMYEAKALHYQKNGKDRRRFFHDTAEAAGKRETVST
ncbi:MAG: GGDEF domain-containing protein [Eubacteriales bacterium]|nr:GGDEF domain-containing protein [Eubacteriales bacterium]